MGLCTLPRPHLVLLRVEVFLRPLLTGAGLHQLERRAVDAVARAQRRGQDEAGLEGGPAAGLQVLGEDVWRVGPQVRPEELTDRRPRPPPEGTGQLLRRGWPPAGTVTPGRNRPCPG